MGGPSRDTTRLSAAAAADAVTDSDSDSDSESDLDSAVLRVIILSLREYCSFVSFSSLLMKGDKVCGCAGI